MKNIVHDRANQSRGHRNGKDNIKTNIDNGYYGLWYPYKDLIEKWTNDNRPVVCCMAGKSIDNELPKLKKIPRENYRLITIDQTQWRLVEEGLKPDLMFTMDFLNFSDLGFWIGMKNTALVAPCSANGENLKAWKGTRYIYRSVSLGNKEHDAEYNQKTVMAGDIGVQYCLSNVGLSVLQFVESIKAESWWIGLDFGFIDNKSYFDGLEKKLGGFFMVPRTVEMPKLGNFKTNDTYIRFAFEFLDYLNKHDYDINYASKGGFLDEDIEVKDDKGNAKRIDGHVIRCDIGDIYK